jgi:hypothetical protein
MLLAGAASQAPTGVANFNEDAIPDVAITFFDTGPRCMP